MTRAIPPRNRMDSIPKPMRAEKDRDRRWGRWPLEDLSPSDSGLPPCHNFFEIGGLEREDDHPILHARWWRIRSHARRLQEGMRHLRGHAARMRLSVRSDAQSAVFRRVRFSSPGQTRRRPTERRILSARLTKRRTLRLRRHGNATPPRGRARPSSKPRPDRPCGGLRRTHSRRLQSVSNSTTSIFGQSSGSYG